ncbi:hypothetical protein R2601_24385 [Salipiger bermudensis HTCC2601]|uniref:Uncharacterized protein n=1 Tax=Salipiger bermudensis (strain DSM 26914 / JCM 13377 / KCTC 12554 / HTCC2601) TaxID=314265 RepID=Q0FKA2_SALBH|nr:hypothetical protein R2601_24385 [Salipiger bermudensis HTCC2601]
MSPSTQLRCRATDLVTPSPLMEIVVLEKERGAAWCDVNSQLLIKLPDHGSFQGLAELNAASKRAHALNPAFVIEYFCRQQPSVTPVQSDCLEANFLRWTPYSHGVLPILTRNGQQGLGAGLRRRGVLAALVSGADRRRRP